MAGLQVLLEMIIKYKIQYCYIIVHILHYFINFIKLTLEMKIVSY